MKRIHIVISVIILLPLLSSCGQIARDIEKKIQTYDYSEINEALDTMDLKLKDFIDNVHSSMFDVIENNTNDENQANITSAADSHETDIAINESSISRGIITESENTQKADDGIRSELQHENTQKTDDEIRPEFQQAMDDSLAFFEEYCSFMKKFEKSDNPYELLETYNSYMSKYVDMMDSLDKMGDQEMSKEELKLYLDTNFTIQKMLIDLM